MNVLHIANFPPDYAGNFGNMLISFAKLSAQKNIGSFFLFPVKRNWHSEIIKNEGEIFYLEVEPYTLKIKHLMRLKEIVKSHNIQIVHTHFGREHYLLSVILKIFFCSELRLVVHWRGHPARPNIVKKVIGTFFYRIINDYVVDAHISNSEYITNKVYEFKIISKKNIYTMPNAINKEDFVKAFNQEIEKIKQKYNPFNSFLILMVRNFRKAVDFSIIIETMAKLKKHNDLKLIWIGYGETEKEIKERIRKEKLENVIFTGKVENTIPFYLSANVAINAYEPWCNETINNSVYEALACGTPVVGLSFGALPLVFSENEGVSCVKLDPGEYAEMILRIKNNYGYYKDKAELGSKRVLNEFSLDSYINKLINIYRGLF